MPPGIDAIEIDQSFKRGLEPAGVVDAGGVRRPGRMQPWRRKPRREKPGRPGDQRETCVELIEPLLRGVALEQRVRPAPPRLGSDAFPERAQLVDACFRCISHNQRPIYGADRYAGDPVGMKIGRG